MSITYFSTLSMRISVQFDMFNVLNVLFLVLWWWQCITCVCCLIYICLVIPLMFFYDLISLVLHVVCVSWMCESYLCWFYIADLYSCCIANPYDGADAWFVVTICVSRIRYQFRLREGTRHTMFRHTRDSSFYASMQMKI